MGRSPRRPASFPGHALLALLALLVAAPAPVAVFDDDPGDVAYALPRDDAFTEGDFDLRRFAVFSDGDDVLFEVTFGAPIRRPQITQRAQTTEVPLWNQIYLQNVDVYVDTDAAREGFSTCIPGRRVAFAGGRTWKAAVVLTPQPGAARGVVEEAMGEAARHVFFAEGLEVRGRTVTARVPAAIFGGPPKRSWAYSVHVSGASWERSFSVADRIRGSREPNAFTLPVLTIPEPFAFGGAPAGELHPRVVDVLLAPGANQKAVLGSFSEGAFARIPFVSLEPQPSPAPRPAPAAAPPPQAPAAELTVAYVAGNMVSLSGPAAGVEPMQFGIVLGPDGAEVGKVVVVQIVDGGVVASAVEGRERIARGARVRFPPGRATR